MFPRLRERTRTFARSRSLLYAALFAGAAAISAFSILRRLDPFDEGLMLQAARRIADGQLPYRDFLWPYGPGHPLLLAGSFKLLGVSVLWWRIVRTVFDAAVAVAVYAIARRRASRPLALAGWLAAACAMAQPTSSNPIAPALLFSLLALLVARSAADPRRRALGAGALVALTAFWRVDFGLYAAVGALVTLALRGEDRRLGSFAAAACGLTAALYAPFVAAAGLHKSYDDLIGNTLSQGGFWTLPFSLGYDGQLRLAHLPHDLKDLLDFYLPVVLVAALGVALATRALRLRRGRYLPALELGLLVLALGSFAYLRSRNDPFHWTPLIVVMAALLPMLAARFEPPRALAFASAALLALLIAYGAANRASALLRPPHLVPVELAVADGVKDEPAEARALERAVPLVQRLVPPGGPIYVAPRRSDLVRFNDPLFYVLAERDNPLDGDFGLDTSASAQRDIVARLERVRPRVVVRWTNPISSEREPNRRGVPSGSRVLDDWIGGNYRLLERDGYYDVMVAR